jgi:hypothetical protein
VESYKAVSGSTGNAPSSVPDGGAPFRDDR